ncbi:STAS domain-containing protein [Almyronema epifaneia]|uniref:Anti-sigma factor antagonist n=1 Tax=Almyronema epifaneia S1 TaxID=2991925 RepID=A0ABW6IFA2_9CYAN
MDTSIKIIELNGHLDINSSDDLRRRTLDLISQGQKNILIDCQNLSFMDSSGLSALVMAMKATREVGGRLSICAINHQAQMLFKLTGMDKVFEIFANQSEAVACMQV